jgi:hypothetical protein
MSPLRSRKGRVLAALGVATAGVASLLVAAGASSHREAPLITEDPVADATDVYAFVSPDRPDTVTLIGNWIPLEEPAGGPNFHKFGDDVLYALNIDNNGDAIDDVTYEFRFQTKVQNGDTFLYNTGPITALNDPDFNIRQTYTVTEVKGFQRRVLGSNLPTPPVNIGPRSTPNYDSLATAAVHSLPGGIKVFAGQRDDPFFVDLGGVFDLLGLRPLNQAHAIKLPTERGIDNVAGYNTHSIAIQVPISRVTRPDEPVIGVYSTTARRKIRVFDFDGDKLTHTGPWTQVSRLGNPLVNEVVIPLKDKDRFNASRPFFDAQFLKYVQDPEPGRLVPALYPVFSCFPTTPRDDLVSVFLTGLPGLNQPKNVRPSEMLRLNTAMPDVGFPNGRKLADDVTDTELVAIAGAALPSQQCAGQSPNNALTDGVGTNDKAFLGSFPYLASPFQGYESDQNGTK